jgi:hypothetical protein
MGEEQVWSSGSEPGGPESTDLGEPGEGAPLNQVFSINVIFQFASKAIQEQPILVLAIGGAQFVVQLIPSLISTPISMYIGVLSGTGEIDENMANALSQLVSSGLSLLFLPLVMLVQAGGIVATAHWLRTGQLDISKLFTSVMPAFNALIYGLIDGFAVLAVMAIGVVPAAAIGYLVGDVLGLAVGLVGGMLLMFLPMYYVALGLTLGVYSAILEKDGPIAALGRSWAMADGGRLTLFVTAFVFGFVSIIVSCFTCGFGAIPLSGMQVVAMTVAYLCMTRQWALKSDFVQRAAPELG